MTEPQVWTLIGVFATGLFGMMTLTSTMFVRVIKTEIGSVRSEIGSLHNELGTESRSLRAEMQAGFKGVHERIDRMDADVNALMKHTFNIPRD